MSFLNPAILAGLAAVGIPVAIHLINKFRVQRTQWAAMKFLLDTVKRNNRRVQMEDILLLLLRCLVVAALVAAFARPVLTHLVESGSGPGNGPVAAAIVLDNSMSMAQSDGVETRFEKGKALIRQWVDELDPASLVSFFLVSNRADAMIAKPGNDFALLRRNLQLAEVSGRPSDLAQGIRAAYQALKPLEGKNKCEVIVYTDSQSSAWSRIDEVKKLQAENPNIQLKVVVLGTAGEPNLAITELRPEGGVPAVGQPCRVRVTVANYGSTPAEQVRVSLSTDGDAPCDEKTIDRIMPGSSNSVDLFAQFTAAGYHSINASVPPDRLAEDNQRTTAVQVVDAVRVLIVEGSPEAQKIDRDNFFLSNALVPTSPDGAAKYYLKASSTPFSQLAKAQLANYDVVFLANPGAVTDEQAKALTTYVAGGGSVVVFPGAKSDVAKWRSNTAWSDLLPAIIHGDKPVEAPAGGVALQSERFDHPVSAIWNDKSQGNLGAIKVAKYFDLVAKAPAKKDAGSAPAAKTVGGDPVPILKLANEQPAAIEWPFGRGHVVLFATAATAQWSNLPLHPAFVALMQRLVGYLSKQSAVPLVLNPGENFETPVPMELLGKDFSVITPRDKTRRVGGRIDLSGQQAVVRYRDTAATGAYRLFLGDEPQPLAVFAVQLDPGESDLRQFDKTQIDALSEAKKPAAAAAPGPATADANTRVEISKEFWTTLVWITAIAFLGEMALAHRFSRAQ